VIHVTGTNGKTSTTRFIERILREHGLRTGRFTSPHLVRLNERISIDGEPVSDQVLYELWEDTKPVLEIVDAQLATEGEGPLTFFEALAVLGFAIFADAPVDVLVLEVGMGGTWDSTNVADGDVSVFTPISLDHTDRLGNTLAEIAETKSGIIKPNAIVVSALQHYEAGVVLQQVAQAKADRWAQLGSEFEVTEVAAEGFGQRFSVRGLAGEYHNLFLPIVGGYQVENAALAIAAVEAFLGGGQKRIMDDVLRVALADATSPGRLQVLSREPLTVLDAAHNPQGAGVLADTLGSGFHTSRFIGVVAVLADKDAAGILRALEPALTEVIITQSSSARAIPAEELADLAIEIFGEDRVHVARHPASAVQDAKHLVAEGAAQAIIITGSVSLVGDVLALQQAEDRILANDDDWDSQDDDNLDTASASVDEELDD
jgi:dihydrofolate synthase/folylpolyglutamate synthase